MAVESSTLKDMKTKEKAVPKDSRDRVNCPTVAAKSRAMLASKRRVKDLTVAMKSLRMLLLWKCCPT